MYWITQRRGAKTKKREKQRQLAHFCEPPPVAPWCRGTDSASSYRQTSVVKNYFFRKYEFIECKYTWKHLHLRRERYRVLSELCLDPFWPGCRRDQVQHSQLSHASPRIPGLGSAAEHKKSISLLALAAPTLLPVPWQEVTTVAVQVQVLLSPSVTCGLVPGRNWRDGQTDKAAKPCHGISPSKAKP